MSIDRLFRWVIDYSWPMDWADLDPDRISRLAVWCYEGNLKNANYSRGVVLPPEWRAPSMDDFAL